MNIDLIKAGFQGTILNPESAEYAAASRRFTILAERKAKWIVKPERTQDVALAVAAATKAGLHIGVKCGGNNAIPASSAENGLVIDLENLNEVVLNEDETELTIGGGCRWNDIYTFLQDRRVVVVGGGVHIVGVGGHLTGGGWGPLTGKYGLACDHVISAIVVLADGTVAHASENKNSDLLWAIKGGSSNFGIVTQFRLRTYPEEKGSFFVRTMVYSGSEVSTVLAAFREFQARDRSKEDYLMGFMIYTRSPHPPNEVSTQSSCVHLVLLTLKTAVIAMNLIGIAPEEQYAAGIRHFTDKIQLISDKTMTYATLADLSHCFDNVLIGGPRRVMNSAPLVTDLWPGMAEEVWQSFLNYSSTAETAKSIVAFEFHNTRRYRPELSCFPVKHDEAEVDNRAEKWLRFNQELVRGYEKNFGGQDLGYAANGTTLEVDPRDVWGASYPRLRQVKAKYDPNSVFHKFHPIEPEHKSQL